MNYDMSMVTGHYGINYQRFMYNIDFVKQLARNLLGCIAFSDTTPV